MDTRFVSMTSTVTEPISPSSTGSFKFMLYRGRLSAKSSVQLSLGYISMEEKPKVRTLKLTGRIPGGGLSFHLS